MENIVNINLLRKTRNKWKSSENWMNNNFQYTVRK